MFGAYHNAVGHAILDPFHFYNLFRHRFDHLVVVHPPLVHLLPADPAHGQHAGAVRRANRDRLPGSAAVRLAEPRRVSTNEEGGKLTFLCYNYWALNRMAYDARRDPTTR